MDATKECEFCGYDLSGTPGGRCPECGEVAKPPELRGTHPIVPVLLFGAFIWGLAYVGLVHKTYAYGVYVYQNDRAWRVGVALITAGYIAGAWIAIRRERTIHRVPQWLSIWGTMGLAVLAVVGLLVLVWACAAEPRT